MVESQEDVVLVIWCLEFVQNIGFSFSSISTALMHSRVELCTIDKVTQRAFTDKIIAANREKFDIVEIQHHLMCDQVNVVISHVHNFKICRVPKDTFVPIADVI